ncbi:MAG TPA: tetratricopeptide repeat protein, partial [Bacteroidia bacterium]|nr:tetratricopeptide repeat protein [Bacteroidia bacterium]
MNKNKKHIPKPANKPANQKTVSVSFGKTQWLLLALILLTVFLVYIPSLEKNFINYDDDWYIYDNLFVTAFSFGNAGAVFFEFYFGQYSPLPMFFLGILHSISGSEPFIYNFMAVVLHLINIALVCWFMFRLNASTFIALATAALFGLATMQVESVAWASAAFKTGFCCAFFLLSLIAYISYLSSGKLKFYFVSLLFFVLSFLSKEQAVALSLSVVCIDYLRSRNLLSKKVILEKIPYFALAVLFGIITLMATKSNRDALTYSDFSVMERILYACYAVGEYFMKLIAPYQLSAYYPYPNEKNFSIWFYIHPLIVAGIIFLFIRALKKNRQAAFGYLFFAANILFTLVLQVVSVREVVMADRYVYVSSIGLFMIVAATLQHAMKINYAYKNVIYGTFVFYLLVISGITFQRTKVWKTTQALLEDNLKNFTAPLPLVNLGVEYKRQGFLDKAMANYNKSIQLYPDYGLAYVNRGNIYSDSRMDTLALADYNKAIQLKTQTPNVYANRGGVYARNGKYDLALADFAIAIKIDSNFANAYMNRAITYFVLNDFKSAITDYTNYLRRKPDDAGIYCDRGVAFQNLGDDENALRDLNKAIQLSPGSGIYYLNRSYSYLRIGKKDLALSDAMAAKNLGVQVDAGYLQQLQS